MSDRRKILPGGCVNEGRLRKKATKEVLSAVFTTFPEYVIVAAVIIIGLVMYLVSGA